MWTTRWGTQPRGLDPSYSLDLPSLKVSKSPPRLYHILDIMSTQVSQSSNGIPQIEGRYNSIPGNSAHPSTTLMRPDLLASLNCIAYKTPSAISLIATDENPTHVHNEHSMSVWISDDTTRHIAIRNGMASQLAPDPTTIILEGASPNEGEKPISVLQPKAVPLPLDESSCNIPAGATQLILKCFPWLRLVRPDFYGWVGMHITGVDE